MRYRESIIVIFASMLMVLALTGCGTKGVTAVRSGRIYSGGGSPRGGGSVSASRVDKRVTIDESMAEATQRLLREANSWLGTEYVYGGNDRTGVDCSGFVTQVYKNSLNILLPRRSAEQKAYCDSIDRSELQAGDLVFFGTRGSQDVGHVGIYIGGGDMIHASTSRGVIVTSIESPYYVSNYRGSGRVGGYAALIAETRQKEVIERRSATSGDRGEENASGMVMIEDFFD